MSFSVSKIDPAKAKTPCLVVPVFDDAALIGQGQELNRSSNNALQKILDKGDITGAIGSSLLLYNVSGINAERILLVGAGKPQAKSRQEYFKVANSIINTLQKHDTKTVTLLLEAVEVTGEEFEWVLSQFTTRYLNHCYRFHQFKSKTKKITPKTIRFSLTQKVTKAYSKAIAHGEAVSAGMSVARDLGNLPGNVCTPDYLLKESRKLAAKHTNITVKSASEAAMANLGMGAFLSVSKGSSEPGHLITIQYKGGKAGAKPHVLVGKGITFDTGGISLKPGAAMDEMKFDMCGAASVLGTLTTVAQLQLPINVIGLIAAAENMPSGHASKPGDIVTSMSGQTIEILNTDAEGRLVLCDALTYTTRFKPASVVDIATLTGACVIALGHHATAIYSNDDDLGRSLLEAGEQSGDRGWPMPLWDEYQNQLDSPFADMANIGGRTGGSITAACFLSRYSKEYPWAHLDIAGTAWISHGTSKGSTGRPVPMLTEYLIGQC